MVWKESKRLSISSFHMKRERWRFTDAPLSLIIRIPPGWILSDSVFWERERQLSKLCFYHFLPAKHILLRERESIHTNLSSLILSYYFYFGYPPS